MEGVGSQRRAPAETRVGALSGTRVGAPSGTRVGAPSGTWVGAQAETRVGALSDRSRFVSVTQCDSGWAPYAAEIWVSLVRDQGHDVGLGISTGLAHIGLACAVPGVS